MSAGQDHKPLMSVIICTYNRWATLQETLQSLLAQNRGPDLTYEILVVDNNSRDETPSGLAEWAQRHPGTLRFVRETRQGLSFARNRGLAEVRSDYIVFTDDDVRADPEWLRHLWRCFQETGCDAVGGRIVPDYPAQTPAWVRDCADDLTGPVTRHDHGTGTCEYDRARMKPFVGANMAFKRNVLSEAGPFRTDLGVGRQVMGEDTELFERLRSGQKTIYYCGSAVVYHPVARNRMSLRYIARAKEALGRYQVMNNDPSLRAGELKLVGGVPRYCLRVLLLSAGDMLVHLFDHRKFIPAWNTFFLHLGIMKEFRARFLNMRGQLTLSRHVRRAAKFVVCEGLARSGLLDLWYRKAVSRRRTFPALIIDLHSVRRDLSAALFPEPAMVLTVEAFRRTLEMLKRYFEVIPLDRLVEQLKDGEPFTRPVAALTVDDGFADNHELMFPVLKEMSLPATVFLTAGFIGTNQKIWIDRIEEALAHSVTENLVVPGYPGPFQRFPLRNLDEKRAAFINIVEWLKGMEIDARQSIQDEIEKKLNYQPSSTPLMLNWDQIREMEMAGITFGAHTLTHAILSRMPAGQAQAEILGSKQLIEQQLGHPVRHFAFPNGGEEDFTPELGDFCRQLGFASVSSTIEGVNETEADRWMLKRFCPCQPPGLFATVLLQHLFQHRDRQ